MLQTINKRRGGFTLVEIMIVVAIIALLAAIAVPNFLRARKRSQATIILEELRVLQDADTLYQTDHPAVGAAFTSFDLLPYIKQGSNLYNAFDPGSNIFVDTLGNHFNGWATPDGEAHWGVADQTYSTLSDVAPLDFWSGYLPPDLQ